MSTTTKIKICDLRRNAGTQSRTGLDEETVLRYVECIDQLPPVVVFCDGKWKYLVDGFHRVDAHERAGRKVVQAVVKRGSLRDAILYSVGQNATHGLPRTNADKRRAAETLLRDEEWRQWSDRAIAERCGVSRDLVGDVRSKLYPDSSNKGDRVERKFERSGRVLRQKLRTPRPKLAEHAEKPQPKPTEPVAVAPVDADRSAQLELERPEVTHDPKVVLAPTKDKNRTTASWLLERMRGLTDLAHALYKGELALRQALAERTDAGDMPQVDSMYLTALGEGARASLMALEDLTPHVDCHVCHGHGVLDGQLCTACTGQGWLSKRRAETLATLGGTK